MKLILILILIILLLIIAIYFYIRSKIQNFSKQWFGTKDFISAIKNIKDINDQTPKTPYGMESLLLPKLEEDFPNLNLDEMKKVAENNIILCFKSIENKKLEDIENISNKLKNLIKSNIDNISANIKINPINIHKTVINKYDNKASVCRLVFQTSIGYTVSKGDQKQLHEDRINTEFIYIFDDKNISSNEAISLNCPNCGAPIKNLGEKFCPYCKTGIIDLAPKLWKFNDINIV